jgi:3-methyladenine DNA glycosylase/8-oxoguanine DNA glycosylase
MHSQDMTWRTFRVGQSVAVVRFRDISKAILADIYSNSPLDEIALDSMKCRLVHAYGLEEPQHAFARLAQSDPVLKPVWKRMRGMRISCPESLFEIAIISLLLQNTTIKRSTQMLSNLLAFYGKRVMCDGHVLFAFFTPEEIKDISEETFRRDCRLGYRAKYIVRFAEYFSRHQINAQDCTNASKLRETLEQIHGVGPYTSNVIASHALRDPSAIPYDVWNRRIYSKMLFGTEDVAINILDKEMRDRYGEYAGLAALYLVENVFIEKPLVSLINNININNKTTQL